MSLHSRGVGARPEAAERREIDEIGIGLLGYGFMGRAHTNAYRTLSYMIWPPPLFPKMVLIGGRDADAVESASVRYGYEGWTTDWRELARDPRVQLFDNGGPNNVHAEATIEAARNGKHVLCEKPLGRDAAESFEIWREVAAAGVKHMCGFNYRFVPAVRMAREMVDSGELGEIRHFRGRYLQDWGADGSLDTWRFRAAEAGSGSLGDLGSHVVDLARFLVGEIVSVAAISRTFVAGRQVDDAVEAVIEFERGAVGTLEVTRLALGQRNSLQWEINGTKTSVAFDLERFNELRVYRSDQDRARGPKTVLVSDADMPFWSWWWPPGHVIGWEHTFIHEIHHLLSAISGSGEVSPYGATFEDGYRAAEVCDAMLRSGTSGQRERVSYRVLPR